ncbi:hypothetical protein [Oryza sativa Japonica Group]|uniref:Uncharacterized protein B1146F03.29 n=1 Tax=Oryza sativa subsp. japonica TaxID=39947 RepID=Q657I2_ORYSJ|nr:hypothetical protein [Oryza sativa Japonica Group]
MKKKTKPSCVGPSRAGGRRPRAPPVVVRRRPSSPAAARRRHRRRRTLEIGTKMGEEREQEERRSEGVVEWYFRINTLKN